MNFQEALKAKVTKEQARIEIEKHNLNFAEFVQEKGDKEFYSGKVVLFWMGY